MLLLIAGLQDISSQDSILPVFSRLGGHIASTYYTCHSGHAHAVIHVFARVCRTLGSVQDFLTQLPVRRCGIVVITIKVLAGH